MRGIRRISRVRVGRTRVLIGALAVGASLALPCASLAIAPVPGPKPPLVYAGYTTEVSTSSATLNVRVNPRGVASTYYIQYGPTTAYGFQTPTASAGNGGEVKLTQAVTGLQPATVYHYRVVATSSAGTAEGPDAVFTTKAIPLTMTITTAPDPVVYGEPLSVFGTLTGTGNAGAAVVLQANYFPYTKGFSTISAPQLTNAAGAFQFALPQLAGNATLRVALAANPNVHSPGVAEHVSLSVTLHVRPATRRGRHGTVRHGLMRLYGTVMPRRSRGLVVIERLTRGRHGREYVAVGRAGLKPAPHGVSQFSRIVPLHPGAYRVLVQAWGAQVSGLSRTIVVR